MGNVALLMLIQERNGVAGYRAGVVAYWPARSRENGR
jgi:hypothetical protein